MSHVWHKVTFSGDGDPPAQQPALVLEGDASGMGALKLLVWQGSDGWTEKTSVPHGSDVQGYTWH